MPRLGHVPRTTNGDIAELLSEIALQCQFAVVGNKASSVLALHVNLLIAEFFGEDGENRSTNLTELYDAKLLFKFDSANLMGGS